MLTFQFRPRHPVQAVAFSPCGRFLLTGQNFVGVAVREVTTGTPLATVPRTGWPALSWVGMDPTGRYLATTGGAKSVIADLHANPPAVSAEEHGICAFTDGQALFGFPWGCAWCPLPLPARFAWWQPPARQKDFRSRVSPVGFVDRLAVVVRNTAAGGGALVDPSTALQVATLRASGAKAFAPPVRVVAAGSAFAVVAANGAFVYDATGLEPPAKGQRVKPILRPVFRLSPNDPPLGGWFPPVAVAPDAKSLLVGGPRSRVRWIDIPTGEVRREWAWRTDDVRCLAFSPDGLTAALGARFGRVVVWDLDG